MICPHKAKFANPLERAVDLSGDLLHERIPTAKYVSGEVYELVCVRGMRQVIDCEDEGFGKTAEVGFMRQGIFLRFFEGFLVGVGRGDLFLDFGGVELPLVLQEVKLLRPGFGVYDADLFALFEKHPLHAERFTVMRWMVDT